jgi:anti-anti-sigma regulatory factor
MRIDSVSIEGGRLLRIDTPLDFSTDLRDLKQAIDAAIVEGILNIAVSLHSGSHLCSMSIGMLIQYHADLVARGGKLTLIQPNAADADLLEALTITRVIEIRASEEEFLQHRQTASSRR